MAAITTPPSPQRTIILKCDRIGEKYLEGRVETAKSVTPGMLVERTVTDGGPDGIWQPHSTAGGFAEPIVALESGWVADIPFQTFSGGTIDDAYAAGDLLRMHHCQPGDEMYMMVAPSAAAIVLTDFLESTGNGYLRKASSTNQRLFKPLEAVDNSANASTAARIRVRKL